MRKAVWLLLKSFVGVKLKYAVTSHDKVNDKSSIVLLDYGTFIIYSFLLCFSTFLNKLPELSFDESFFIYKVRILYFYETSPVVLGCFKED